jgi:hypothetical protein
MPRLPLILCLIASVATFRSSAADAPTAVEPLKQLDPAHKKALAESLGAKPGETKGRVHPLTLPRDDLDVYTAEFGEIPPEAGLATTLRLWRCTCGKYYLVGDFCVADYESNDVIDALRAGGHISIASVSPLLLHEKPRLLSIRIQGEGDIDTLTKPLKEALRWMGANRSKKNPIE